MGIHNSFSFSSVWRVANHINMKAFVTICSFLATSASADSQYIQNVVNLNQPLGIAPLLGQYGVYSAPISPISYANMVDLRVDPAFPISTMLIKREAEPDTPYVYKTKVDNPEDGSKYEIDVLVDRFGHGQSHQQIQRQPIYEDLRSNYLMDQRMEQNMNDLGQRNQMRFDNRHMGRMMSDQKMMVQRPRMTYGNNLDSNRMSPRMRNQMMRGQDKMGSRMYSMMDQTQMDKINQRKLEINMSQINRNMADRRIMDNMAARNQMQSRRMIKREADPSFQYTISAGHPVSPAVYRMSQNMRNQVYGNEMGLVNQMVKDNMMIPNQMHSGRMIKREADPFIVYSLPTMTNYQVPFIMEPISPVHIMA